MRNLWIGLLLLTGLAGCQRQDDLADLRVWVGKVGEPGTLAPTTPTTLAVERLTVYRAGTEQSPFLDRTATALDTSSLPAPSAETENSSQSELRLLAGVSLDELTLVGTISGMPHTASQALFRDNEGRIHRLSAGDRVGREDARLVAVTETRVEMLETVPLVDGGWITQTRNFALLGQPNLGP
ncbi:pilus assembly protein PilP [Saccharospirillum mangrovi]|uniref:pilus assembly protein PilP n=1 Tax=Saccharospirillum mangrovi TaxID=2161747 RepID=UPI000D3882E7|nr:pilus assembly protein PilP [Saccharospirillum mangrovi]